MTMKSLAITASGLLIGTLSALAQEPAPAPAPATAPATAASATRDHETDPDRQPATHTHGDVLLKNGTVLTVTHGALAHADVLVRHGKIEAVGSSLVAPEGVPVIDLNGKYVMPGVIDCHSHIAVLGNVNEGTVSISAEVRIADVLEPDDVAMLPGAGGRRHRGQHPAWLGQHDRRAERGDQAQVPLDAGRAAVPRRAARHQVRARREPEAIELHERARASAFPTAAWASRPCCVARSCARRTTWPNGTSTRSRSRAASRSWSRGAICASRRSPASCAVRSSCTRTVTAPTRS
jgi:hypothetical protein